MSYYHHLIKSSVGNGALTTAWIAATSETDATIISALNTLETDLTTYGLTTKIKALYPMVGGSAAKHKFNFLDARDLDAAFRLTFSGGWTHASTGSTPNGVNAYADTKFNLSTSFSSLLNMHHSFYSRSNVTSGLQIDLGATSTLQNLPYYSGNAYVRTGISDILFSVTDSLGLVMGSRLDAITQKAYKNGVLKNTSTSGLGTVNNINIYIGAFNDSAGANYYSTRQCAFSSIGSGLTDGEAANLYTAVQAFQTTLSRQV